MAEILSRKLAQAIASGDREIFLWSRHVNWVIYEWQRQISASHLIENNGVCTGTETLLNVDIIDREKFLSRAGAKSVVINNLAFTSAANQLEQVIKGKPIGKILPPLSLQKLAHILFPEQKAFPKNEILGLINSTIPYMLCKVTELEGTVPSNESLSVLASYHPQNYVEEALALFRQNAKRLHNIHSGNICLVVGSLPQGGAERQLCNLAVGLKRAGWNPTVLSYELNASEAPHYIRYLKDNGIPYLRAYPKETDPTLLTLSAIADCEHTVKTVLWHLPPDAVLRVLHTYRAFQTLRPEIVISYLDWQNSVASLAATMVGTPHILMSGRSHSPDHFAYQESTITAFKEIYKIVLKNKDVHFCNNSTAGAKSYKQWGGFTKTKIQTVPNALTEEFISPVSAKRIKSIRNQFSVEKGQPFIIGVFRLEARKRPEDFMKIVAKLRNKHPTLRAALCGSGQNNPVLRELIEKLCLEDCCFMPGVITDIPALMKSATLLLHPSQLEGLPNVLIEAQAIGLPVVCADNDGIRECIDDVWKKYIRKPGDITGLAESCHKILSSTEQCAVCAKSAQQRILKKYSIEKLTTDTLLAGGLSKRRITSVKRAKH